MKKLLILTAILFAAAACNPGDGPGPVPPTPPDTPEGVLVNPGETITGGITGFYLLNEGQFGANNATIDYYNYSNGYYVTDVFAAHNPDVTFGLGDTGNDLEIHNGRLYAVMNGSSLLIVMNAADAKYVGRVAIPNPRSIVFDGAHAYVTSYAAATMGDGDHRGHVAKIDLGTLQQIATCEVGNQPDEMAIVDGKLYVANSGGYNAPNYETTVSVIDLASFTESKRIEVAPNLNRVRRAPDGLLYVSSRGDYGMTPPAVYTLDPATEQVIKTPIAGSDITVSGSKVYSISTVYGPGPDYLPTNQYSTYDITTGATDTSVITDGTDSAISVPYGVAIHPASGDILIGDARDFTGGGVLSCYSGAGVRRWQVSVGVVPSHIAMITE